MAGEIVYLKAERNVEVKDDDVFLKDIAKVYCVNGNIAAKVKAIKVHRFAAQESKRQVLGILKLIEMIQQACPNVTVENLGETDVLVERVNWLFLTPRRRWRHPAGRGCSERSSSSLRPPR